MHMNKWDRRTLGLIVVAFLVLFSFSASDASGASVVEELDESDIFNKIGHGEWLIDFYAPWCPHCRTLEPIFEDFAKSHAKELGIQVGKVNVAVHSSLSGRFQVSGLPTIYHIKDGEYRLYSGQRAKEAFLSFIKEKKWKDTDPLAWWRSPSSIIPQLFGYFHVFAYFLQDSFIFLKKLTGYGDSAVAIGFGLCAVLFAAFIGLILGCVFDFFFPEGDEAAELIARRQAAIKAREEALKKSGSSDKDNAKPASSKPPRSKKID
eukprot:Nk52_evm33s2209 gene=Nk52_evmTU33s2209